MLELLLWKDILFWLRLFCRRFMVELVQFWWNGKMDGIQAQRPIQQNYGLYKAQKENASKNQHQHRWNSQIWFWVMKPWTQKVIPSRGCFFSFQQFYVIHHKTQMIYFPPHLQQLLYFNCMFKPNLKRKQLAQMPTKVHSFHQNQPHHYKSTNIFNIIPSTFLQKSHSQKASSQQVYGILNTCKYAFPYEIMKEMEDQEKGVLELNGNICWFYKNTKFWIWEYKNNKFDNPMNICSTSFLAPITAVFASQIQFQNKQIPSPLIIIAFGLRIQLFSLSKSYFNTVIQPLLICIVSSDVVTKLEIFNQKPSNPQEKAPLLLLYGEASGYLNAFDMRNKSKFQTDTILSRMQRKIRGQEQNKVKEILVVGRYIYCLVSKNLVRKSWLKRIRQFWETPESVKQDVIQLYSIQNREKYEKMDYNNIANIQLSAQISSKQLAEKLKKSYSNYVDENQPKIQISSIKKRGLNVEVIFKNGLSVQISQSFAFTRDPINLGKVQNNIKFYSHPPEIANETARKKIVDSIGSDLIVFEDYLIGKGDISYISPFSSEKKRNFQTSIFPVSNQNNIIKNNEYVIVEDNGLVHVSQLKLSHLLVAYCSILEDNQNSSFTQVPSILNFQGILKNLLEFYGETQLLLAAFCALIQSRKNQKLQLRIRNDIYNIIKKEIFSGNLKNMNEWEFQYNIFRKEIPNFKIIYYTPTIENLVWEIILKVESHSISSSETKPKFKRILPICSAMQRIFQDNLRKIEQWNPQDFWFRKELVGETILTTSIIEEVLQVYLKKQMGRDYHQIVMENGKSPKIKYCETMIQSLKKIKIILAIYDYFGEINLKNEKIPHINEIIYNFDEQKKYKFAEFLISELATTNSILLQQIEERVPELQLTPVRKFKEFINFQQNCCKEDPTCSQSFFLENHQIQELSEIITSQLFLELQEKYIKAVSKNNHEKANRMGRVVIATMKKIASLKAKQSQYKNILINYKNSSNNSGHFELLEFPNIEANTNEVHRQRIFLIMQAERLVRQLFEKFSSQQISKNQLTQIIQVIQDEAPAQIKEQTEKHLKRYGITNIKNKKTIRSFFEGQYLDEGTRKLK